MIYTKEDEIETVRENLKAFEGNLSPRLTQQLLKQQLRNAQHGLFFTLCNPRIYPHLIKALEIIKTYNKPKYFAKAIKKLTSSALGIDQQAAVAEIIAVAYYFQKFYPSANITVEWEREVPNSKKLMDITLIGLSKMINIEVTAKDRDARQNKHFNLRYKVKVALEQALESISNQKYKYIFSLATKDDEGTAITEFSEMHIEDFVSFILQKRVKGTGEYNFDSDGVNLATVIINPLNNAKAEFAADLDMWTGFLNDEKRIRNRVVDKAREQLPADDINFVFVPNLAGFDEIDYQEAFFGKEQWHIGKSEITGVSRKPDGIIQVISENDYSPVHGLIWSGWDYTKKRILINPLLQIEENVLELIK